MKIGFIGYGEAAFNLSKGLHDAGVEEICAFDSMAEDPVFGQPVKRRAAEAQIHLLHSACEIVEQSEIIFAAVPSSYTLGVCEWIKDCLHSGQMYVDVSASTPETKRAIWALLEGKGIWFVDAAMLGSLPKDKHRVPITASGNGAERFRALMAPYGMNITSVGKEAGNASAIKLIRSIYMKGISALMLETVEAAEKYNVSEEVIASLSESFDGICFTDHLDRLVIGSAIHSKRRAAELKGSMQMLLEAGITPIMAEAGKHKLETLEPFDFARLFTNCKPNGWKEIVQIIQKT